MDPIRKAIQFHLGRDIGDSPVTLYSLLGVSLDASVQEIKSSFAIAAKRWNESDRQSNPALANEVGALLKEAKRVLLNEELRYKYDATLMAKVVSSTAAQSANLASNSMQTIETNWLPEEDPYSPFDESDYIKQSLASLQTSSPELNASQQSDRVHRAENAHPIEERYSQLMTLVSAELKPESDNSNDLPTYELSGFDYRARVGMQSENPDFTDSPLDGLKPLEQQSGLNEHLGESASRPASSIISRRQADPRQRAVTFGLFALGGSLIAGVGIYALYSGSGRSKVELASNPSTLPTAVPSNMPSSPHSDIQASDIQEQSQQPNSDRTTLGEEGGDSSAGAASNSTSTLDSGEEEPVEVADESMGSELASAPPTTATLEAPSVNTEEIEHKLSELNSSLQRADFEAFKELTATLPAMTGDEGLDAKQARLLQMGELYQAALIAFEQSKAKLKVGSTLQIGNRELKVTDNTSDSLSVRSLSGVKSYAWADLPLGIKLAILEDGLDSNSPENAAAQAVFLKFQNQPEDLIQPRIAKLIQQSQGNGTVRDDFGLSFLDKYN